MKTKSFKLWTLRDADDDDAKAHVKECLVLVVDTNLTFKGLTGAQCTTYTGRGSSHLKAKEGFLSGQPSLPVHTNICVCIIVF